MLIFYLFFVNLSWYPEALHVTRPETPQMAVPFTDSTEPWRLDRQAQDVRPGFPFCLWVILDKQATKEFRYMEYFIFSTICLE